MGGGNVGEGVIVDLTRLPLRLEVRPPSAPPITSANVTLADLNGAADRHGLRLPPDPSSGRLATLGGMLSTNAAGARSVRYGSVRRWVAGGRAGDRRRRGPGSDGAKAARDGAAEPSPLRAEDAAPAIRAAATADRAPLPPDPEELLGLRPGRAGSPPATLLDLVIGAEGTLGIVTGIEWRLDPQPAHRAGLRVELRSLDDLVHVVAALLAREPSAVELLDRTFLDLVRHTDAGAGLGDGEAILLVEIERGRPGRAPRRRWRRPRTRCALGARAVETALSPAAPPSGSGQCATPRARSSPRSRRTGARSRSSRTPACRSSGWATTSATVRRVDLGPRASRP